MDLSYHNARHGQQNAENDSNQHEGFAGGHAGFLSLLLLGFLGELLRILLWEQGLDELLNLEGRIC